MTRSTKTEKARRLNAARGLLERHVALPEAVQRFSRVRTVRTSSISVPGGGLRTGSTGGSYGGYGSGHDEASATHGGTAAEVREKQWPDDWSDRERRVERISKYSEKAWLSRGPRRGKRDAPDPPVEVRQVPDRPPAPHGSRRTAGLPAGPRPGPPAAADGCPVHDADRRPAELPRHLHDVPPPGHDRGTAGPARCPPDDPRAPALDGRHH